MPQVFDKLGISFQYPDNWTLETDESRRGHCCVSVNSPGGAFWTVMLEPLGSDPVQLAQAALTAMRQDYDELDSESVHERMGETELVGFDVNFYCLDLTNTAWIRAGKSDSVAYLILCQAEDREFSEVSDVFRAITASLLGIV